MMEDADGQALDNARVRSELLDKADFQQRYEPIIAGMRQIILGTPLPDADKDALLDKLARLHSI
jgi:hypothetical protein